MKEELRKALINNLPGHQAHERMTSRQRKIELQNPPEPFEPRKSSVLVLLFEQDHALQTIMIQRPKYEGVHSGQIAFPGGKMEVTDKDLTATALRETTEEIGIPAQEVEVIGQLTELYIAPSNFLVQPVVGWLKETPHPFPDPTEVDEILILPVNSFLLESSIQQKEVEVRDFKITVPCYVVNEHVIWGASAMIMTEFIEVMESVLNPRNRVA